METLSLDEQRLILTYVPCDRSLAALYCTSRLIDRVVAKEETDRRRRLARVAEAAVARDQRLARARFFAAAENDATLIASVVRHMLNSAPRRYLLHLDQGARKKKRLQAGVHRLRVGVSSDDDAAMTHGGDEAVDVLAMQESSLRRVVFCGVPLGPLGAAVAVRQARNIGLVEEEKTVLGGHTFRLCFRADLLVRVLASSPSLQELLVKE